MRLGFLFDDALGLEIHSVCIYRTRADRSTSQSSLAYRYIASVSGWTIDRARVCQDTTYSHLTRSNGRRHTKHDFEYLTLAVTTSCTETCQ